MAQKTTTIVELRYNRRFPNVLTVNITQQLPAMLTELKIVVIKLASHGIPYAFNTWMIYARQTIAPENSNRKFKVMARMNGFSVRCRRNSRNLSKNVVFVVNALWLSSRASSSRTVSADTQPRNLEALTIFLPV